MKIKVTVGCGPVYNKGMLRNIEYNVGRMLVGKEVI